MAKYDYNKEKRQKLKKEILKNVEEAFNAILKEKYVPACNHEKEAIKFKIFYDTFNRLFTDLNRLYKYNTIFEYNGRDNVNEIHAMKNNLYIQKIQIILLKLYEEELRPNTLLAGFMEKKKVINVELAKPAMENALCKIKNLKFVNKV